MDDQTIKTAQNIGLICDAIASTNPVLWHELHKAGLTIAELRKAADSPEWQGPKPCFFNAPKPTDPFWLYLESKSVTPTA